MFRIKRILKAAVISLFLALSLSTSAKATCLSDFKLLDLVNWGSVFPISIAGIEIAGSADAVTTVDTISSPICVCPAPPPLFIRIGLTVGFWEPARYIETVKDPGCLPSLGINLGITSGGELGGTNSSVASTAKLIKLTFIKEIQKTIFNLLIEITSKQHTISSLLIENSDIVKETNI